MTWSAACTHLILSFARRMAEVSGTSVDETLRTATPLYLNLGLSRSFDPQDPLWRALLAGYHSAADKDAWTHAFYLTHARRDEDSPYGCFSYAFEQDTRSIRFHFANHDTSGEGALSVSRAPERRYELAAMFADIRERHPDAGWVRGRSWLYYLAAYRRLFPPAYAESAVAVDPELQFMSLWGQFLDRHGELRREPTTVFRDRIASAASADDLRRAFPLPVRAPRCSIDHFYTFYGD